MIDLEVAAIRESVRRALEEDVGPGDATSLACVPAHATSHAVVRSREPLVVAGLAFACETFRWCSPAVRCDVLVADSTPVDAGTSLLRVSGPSRALLTGERVALNFLQRLSGVATLTRAFLLQLGDLTTRLLDTRKTTPGWRTWEKYAVACGGGTNHRMGLYDRILIKDNHLVALRDETPNPVAAAIHRARELFPHLLVEVEADRMEQVQWAVDAEADIILLDNFSIPLLREAVHRVARRSRTEASGGVRLDTLLEIARTGVDFISVGAITHSARSVDLGLDFTI